MIRPVRVDFRRNYSSSPTLGTTQDDTRAYEKEYLLTKVKVFYYLSSKIDHN